MDPTAKGPNSRRGQLILIGVLSGVLLVGGAFLLSTFVTAKPQPGPASARDSVTVIETGLASASEYQRGGQYAEAAAILGKLAEQAPTDRAVRLAYAQALLGQKRYEQALPQFDAAIALSSSTSAVPGTTGQQRDPVLAQLHFEAGTCANAAGLIDEASEHYQSAQTLDAGEPRYPLYLAMIQVRADQDAAAMASLVRAIKLNPDLAEAWGTMAELELKSNRLSLAQQHLDKAMKLQPEVSRWRIAEARILNRQGDPERAATILQALPPGELGSKSVMSLLAESFGMMRKPGDAGAMYERAYRNTPNDSELAYLAATWYQRAGQPGKARTHAQTASTLGHAGAKELLAGLDANP